MYANNREYLLVTLIYLKVIGNHIRLSISVSSQTKYLCQNIFNKNVRYAPIKVNHGVPQPYDRDPSYHKGDSNNINSFRHSDITNGRIIDLLGWDSCQTMKANGSVRILTNFFFVRILWVSLKGRACSIHIDMCIRDHSENITLVMVEAFRGGAQISPFIR